MIAGRAASAFAHPASIVGLPLACVAWLELGFGVDRLTLALSILAITMTQLVLAAQARDTAAVYRKLDALVHGTGTDDAVAGCEAD